LRIVDQRRQLPSIERVVDAMGTVALPHTVKVACARRAVEHARELLAQGRAVVVDAVVADARQRCADLETALLQPVVNATGVLLHTNLGRTPLGADDLEAATRIARGYSNLEFDMARGERGSRHLHAGGLLALASGAEAGLVVNNNAAAVLLALAALARGRDVVVSRGELVEIGGGFRIPEILAESGARLVEVGTTNRTRLIDYERAITDSTALVLKVHTSNYRMMGFVESVEIGALAPIGLPVLVDAGSGLLDAATPWLDHRPSWLSGEPGIRQCLDAGAALVTFSGDKLFGGPQAGIIVGRADLVARCARHPLARALRADKLTLALLQQVALTYLSGNASTIPFWRMATWPLSELRRRAEAIASAVEGAKVVDTEAVPGGGSVPGTAIASIGVALPTDQTDAARTELRRHGVIARIEHDAVVCDLRAVAPADDTIVAAGLAAVVAARL
jgi:L-seryl-tRNA(Ser) seleniumtransferase